MIQLKLNNVHIRSFLLFLITCFCSVSGYSQTTGTVDIVEATVNPGSSITITVSDVDLDINTGLVETVNVEVDNSSTGENETVSLTETGLSTGIFTNTLLTTFGTGPGTNDDMVLTVSSSETIQVTYSDANPAASPTDNAIVNTDVTAPSFINSTPTLTQTGSDEVTVTFDLDENSMIWYVVTDNSTAPSDTDIKAGTGGLGSVLTSQASIAYTTGSASTDVKGSLTIAGGTSYYAHLVAEDAVMNQVTMSTTALVGDITAPSFINSTPTLTQTGSDEVTVTFDLDENSTIWYVVTDNSTAPSDTDIKAGTGGLGSVLTSQASIAYTTGSASTDVKGSLTIAGGTSYYAHLVAEDAVMNQVTMSTTALVGDVTAPSFINSTPTLTQTGSDEVTVTFDLDENSTIWYVVTDNSTAPSDTDIKAGMGGLGSVLTSQASIAYTTGSASTDVKGSLTIAGGTSYYAHLVAEDAAMNQVTASTTALVGDIQSALSDISEASFTYFENINYLSFNGGNTITDVSADAITLASFNIRDGASSSDADDNATRLDAITFSISNWENLDYVQLFDLTNDVSSSVVQVTSGSVSFSSLAGAGSFEAADNGTANFVLRATFKQSTDVDDREAISFTITTATAETGLNRSNFQDADAGGAFIDISGDMNVVDVVASKIVFTASDPNGSTFERVSDNISFTLQAHDANDNIDINEASVLDITGPTSPSVSTITLAAGTVTPSFQISSEENSTTLTITDNSNTGSRDGTVTIGTAATANINVFDRTAPTINDVMTDLTPGDDGVNVAATQTLTLVFTEPVAKVSGDITIVRTDETPPGVTTVDIATSSVAVSDETVTVTLPQILDPGGSFYVIVPSGAFDDSPNNSAGIGSGPTGPIAFSGLTTTTSWDFTTASVPVVSIDDVTVGEADGTLTFTVAVSEAANDGNIVIAYAVSDGTATSASLDYTLSNGTVTFPNGDATSQTIIATIGEDDLIEGSETFTVTLSIDGTNAEPDVLIGTTTATGTITDNDIAGFTIVQTDVDINESDSGTPSGSFTLELDAEPTSNVELNVVSNDTGEGTVAGNGGTTIPVVFTPGDWDTPQQIDLTGIDDDLDDDNVVFTVTVSVVDASSDNNFDGLGDQTVNVTTADDDAVGFTVSETAITVSEDGATTDDFTVVLDAEPLSVVILDLSIDDATEASLDKSSLTFNPSNWDTPQLVTVTGVNDDLDDGDQTGMTLTISVNAASSEDSFDVLADQTVTVTTTDDETSGFTLGATTATTNEDLSGESVTIVLDSEPTGTVVLDITDDGSNTEVSFTTTLSFDNTDWNVAKNIVLTGLNDNIDDGDIAEVLTVAINTGTTTDALYDALGSQTITVTNGDDDTAGFTIVETDVAIGEDLSTGSFTVVLDTEPTSSVSINVVSDDTGEGTVAGNAGTSTTIPIVFTTGNWNVAQQIDLTGVNDNIIDGDVDFTITLSIVDASSDDVFDPLADQQVTVTNTDNDVAGFTIVETDVSINETDSGTPSGSFTIVLDAQPLVDVQINVVSNDTDEGTVAGNGATTIPVVFTNLNWNSAQQIDLTGVDDNIDDGDVVFTVTASVVDASSDDAFDGVADQTVNVTNVDDDAVGFTLSKTTASVTEAGSTDNFTVVLTSQPLSAVVLDLSVDDGTEASIDKTLLTFNAGNWNAVQTVTISGEDDDVDDGDQTPIVTISVNAASSEDNFDGLSNQTVTVTTTDDETSGFTLGATTATTNEDLSGESVTIVLDSEPTGTVVLDITDDGSNTEVSFTTTLSFDNTDWNVAKNIVLTGLNDNIDDGDIAEVLTVAINTGTTTDALYDALGSQTITVTNGDDDTAGFTLGAITATTNEDLSGENVTIVLDSEPVGDVVFTIADDGSNDEVSFAGTGALIFDNTDWNVPKNIVIVGLNDTEVDGDIVEVLTVSINMVSTTDGNFDPLADQNITVTNGDDDIATLSIADVILDETSAGTTATFVVTLSDNVSNAVSVDYATMDGSATTGDSDYTSATGTVNFLTGTAGTQNFDITVSGDTKVEGDETFTVTLSNVSAGGRNVTISDAIGIGTIRNDDAATIAIDDVSSNEANTTFTFSVTLTGTIDQSFTVDFATSDGSATVADSDYASQTNTLTFAGNPSGEIETIDIAINQDAIFESDETFNITLTNVQANNKDITISDAIGIGTIQNEDAAPTFTNAAQFDTTLDGDIDQIIITMNESVQESSVVASEFLINGSNTGFTLNNDGADDTDFTFDMSPAISGTATVTVAYTGTTLANIAGTLAQPIASITAVDNAVPVVLSVSSSIADGSYNTGDLIPIQITFSEEVDVTNTPQLTVNATAAPVDYSSGDGSSTLSFDYTVGGSDATTDLGYALTSDLSLNVTGLIRDGSLNNAVLALPANSGGSSLSDNKNIIIDNVAPTVTITGPPTTLAGSTAVFTTTYNTDVNLTTIDEQDYSTVITGSAGYSGVTLNTAGFPVVTYTVSGIVGTGTLGIRIATAGIQDNAGNDLDDDDGVVDGNVTSLVYTIDNSAFITIGTVESDNYINLSESTTVEISGTVSDVEAGQSVTVDLTDAAGSTHQVNTVVVGTGWAVTAFDISGIGTPATFIEGFIDITATVTDLAGNMAIDASVDEVLYDATASLTFDATLEGDNLVNGSEEDDIVITGTSSGISNGTSVIITLTGSGGGVENVSATINSNTWVSGTGDVSGFNEGTITISATATDIAGNISTVPSTQLSIDRSASIATIVVTDDALGDDKISGAEAAALRLSGTTTGIQDGADIVITLSDGTLSEDKTVQVGTNAWNTDDANPDFDISGFQQGPISIIVTSTDVAGNVATLGKGISYDNSATIVINTIEGDDIVNLAEATTVEVSGTTTGVEDGQTVSVTFNGSNTSTTTVSSNTWTTAADVADISGFTDGNVTVNASVSDVVGNSDNINRVVVLDQAVSITVTSFDNAISGTEDNAVDVSGTTDAEAGRTVTLVFEDSNNNEVTKSSTVVAGSPNTWAVDDVNVSGLDDGIISTATALSMTATVFDIAGNEGTDVEPFSLDKTAIVDIDATLMVDNRISDSEKNSVTVSGTSTDIEEDQDVTVTIDDSNGGTPTAMGTAKILANGSWVATGISVSALVEGTLTINATVSDVAGNEATVDQDITFDVSNAIDITFPITVLERAVNGSESGAFIVSGTTTNVETGQVVSITFDDGSSSPVLASAVVSGGSWTSVGSDISSLNEGAVSISVSVTDLAGNTTTDNTTITLDQAISISIDDPLEGDNIFNSAEVSSLVTISGGVIGCEDGQQVTVLVSSGGIIGGSPIIALGRWETTLDLSTLAEGGADVSVSVQDIAENTASSDRSVEIDKSAFIDIDVPIEDDNIVSLAESTSVIISGTTIGIESGQTVSITLSDGSSLRNSSANVSGNSWTSSAVDISSLNEGNISVTVSVADIALNTANDSETIVLDETAIVAIDATIEGDNQVNSLEDDDVVISGTVTDVEVGRTVTVLLDDANVITSAVTSTTLVATGGVWETSLDVADISGLDNGSITISVSVTDLAGNPAAGVGAVMLDNIHPLASIARVTPTSEFTNTIGTTGVVFGVTFNEAVTGIDIGDFTVVGPATSVVSGFNTVSSTSYEVTVTGYTLDGSLDLDFSGGQDITDLANNAFVEASGIISEQGYQIDRTQPTVDLVSNDADAIVRDADLVTITATFVEANSFAANPVISIGDGVTTLVTNASMTATTDPKIWTYAWDVPDNGTIADVDVDASISVTDVAGNVNTAATGTVTYTIDNTAPTVISSDISSSNSISTTTLAKELDRVTVAIEFDEALFSDPIVNFRSSNIPVSGNVMIDDPTDTGIPNTYEAYFDVSSLDIEGEVSYTISFADAAGNSGTTVTVSNSGLFIDKSAPTASIARVTPTSEFTNTIGTTGVFFGVTFNEAVTGIDIGDFTVVGPATSVVSGFNTISSTSYEVIVTGYTLDGSLDLDFSGGQDITDLANNAFVEASGIISEQGYQIDRTQPTVDLVSNDADAIVRDADLVTITATFVEANSFAANPVISIGDGVTTLVSNASMTATTDPKIWTYAWDVPDNGTIADVDVDASISVTDVAGNVNTAATGTVTYTIDNTAPTATDITLVSSNANTSQAKTNDVITLSYTVDDALTGLPLVTFRSGGVPGTLINDTPPISTNVGGMSYETTFTVSTFDIDGDVTFSLSFTDDAGNSSMIFSSVSGLGVGTSVNVDNTIPTVVFSDALSTPSNEDPFSISVDFSEAVTDPIIGSFNINNGVITSVNGTSPNYTLDINPVDNQDANVTIELINAAVTDLAGNANIASGLHTIEFDDIPPVISDESAVVFGRDLTLSATLDEPGNIYYAVVADGVAVTSSDLKDIANSSSAITTVAFGTLEFLSGGSEEVDITLDADRTAYDLYITSEDFVDNLNLKPTPIQIDISSGGVVINTPDLADICLEGDYFVLPDIIIDETISTDFRRSGSNRTLVFELPENFEFNTSVGTLSDNGADLDVDDLVSGLGLKYNSSGTNVTITYSATTDVAIDQLVISGLEIIASGTVEVTSAEILKTGGSGDVYFSSAGDNAVFATLNTIAPFNAPEIITTETGSETQPYILEIFGGLIGDSDREDAVTVYDYNDFDPLSTPMKIGAIAAGNEINIYSNSDLTSSVVSSSLNSTWEPTLNDLLLTADDVGINTFWITVTDSKSCESASTMYSIAIIRYENSSSTSTFANNDQSGSTFKFTFPSDHAEVLIDLAAGGLSVVDEDDDFTSPIQDGASVDFNPSRADTGRDSIEYILTNNIGVEARILVPILVVETTRVFGDETISDDGLCIDIAQLAFDVINDDNFIDFDGIEGGVNNENPDFHTVRIYDFRGSVRGANLSTSFLSAVPDTTDLLSPTNRSGWELDLSAANTLLGTDFSIDIEAAMIIVDEATGIEIEISNEVITLYKNPQVEIPNINEFYCEDDGAFDILVEITSAVGFEERDISTEGYDLYKYDGSDFNELIGSFTGAASTAELDPADLDRDGLDYTVEDESGFYKIIFESSPVTSAGCVTTIERTFTLSTKPDLPLLKNDFTGIGGLDSFGDYLLEYCEGDSIHNLVGLFDLLNTDLRFNWYSNATATNDITSGLDNDGNNDTLNIAEALFGSVVRPTGRQTKELYYSVSDHIGLNGGCESDIQKIIIELYPIPELPSVDLSSLTLPINSGETNDPNQALLGNTYFFEYCVMDGGIASLEPIEITDLLDNESASESYLRVFDSNQNVVDSLVASNLIIDQTDLTNLFGYSAEDSTTLTFYISQRNFDNNFPSSVGAEFEGCEGDLREFVININAIPNAPDTTLFNSGRTDYYLCAGDDLDNIETPREDDVIYSWYEDDGTGNAPSLNAITVSAFNGGFIKQSELELAGFSNISAIDTEYTYWVTQTIATNQGTDFAGCESVASKLTITVYPDPSTPLLKASDEPDSEFRNELEFSYCIDELSGDNTTMNVLGSADSRFFYYISDENKTVIGNSLDLKNGSIDEDGRLNISSLDLFFSNATSNDTRYYLISQQEHVGPNGSDFEGCETEPADMSFIAINIYDIPDIPEVDGLSGQTEIVFCEGDVSDNGISLITEGSSGQSTNWYLDADNDDVPDISVPVFQGENATSSDLNLQNLTGGGFYKFLVTQTQDIGSGVSTFEGCESGALSITILQVPDSPVTTDPDPACNEFVTTNSISILYSGVTNELGTSQFNWYDEDGITLFTTTSPISPAASNSYARDWTTFDLTGEFKDKIFEGKMFVSQEISLNGVTCESEIQEVNVMISPLPLIAEVDNGEQVVKLNVIKSCDVQEVVVEVKLDNLKVSDANITWYGGRTAPGILLEGEQTVSILNDSIAVYTFYPLIENSVRGNSFEEGNNYLSVEIDIPGAAVSLESCVAEESIVFELGSVPQPQMRWDGITKGRTTNFEFRDVNGTSSASYSIDLVELFIPEEGVTLSLIDADLTSSTGQLSYTFMEEGSYQLEVYYLSSFGCDSTLTAEITILDHIADIDNLGITQDFEDGNEGWYVDTRSSDGWSDRDSITWELGLEDWGYGASEEINSTNHWATVLDGTYTSDEKQWVYSPSYDISGLTLPTLSFQHARELSSQDGIVLQSSTDDGRNWSLLGSFDPSDQSSSGKNWYNRDQLSGAPGQIENQTESNRDRAGWTGDSDGWVVSAHKLDPIDSIRFRFALGSIPGEPEVGGFAFDDFKIFNREKKIIIEQFSSLEDVTSVEVLHNIEDNLLSDIKTDGIILNYFTSLADESDTLNLRNQADPGARSGYYGISSIPKTALSGVVQENDPRSASIDAKTGWGVNDFNAISLDEPGFEIGDVVFSGSEQTITVSSSFTAKIDFVSEDTELSFRFAIVEDIYGEQINIDYGIDTLRNVLRKMLPSAAGFTHVGQVSSGQQDFGITFESSWNLSDVFNTDRLKVIVLVQLDTDEPSLGMSKGAILQATIADVPDGKIIPTPETITSTIVLDIDKFDVYPNPSDDYFTVEFGDKLTDDLDWVLYDQTGREVGHGIILREHTGIDVDVSELPSGIYMLKVFDDSDESSPKRVMILH